MEVKGLIHHIGETQAISDKFKKRDIVLTLDPNGKYPQYVSFQVTQDKCSVLDEYKLGDEVNVHFNLRGREYNDVKGIRYFNTLEIWKLDKSGSSQGAGNANPSVSTGGNQVDDNQDLPF